jgi:hypothetical protein
MALVAFADFLQIRQAHIRWVESFDRRAAAGVVFSLFALLLTSGLVAAFLNAREFLLTFLECSV